MGCDIHSFSERKAQNGAWESLGFAPFEWRSYGVFAFLAGVRNYSAVTPIAEKRGLPSDISSHVFEENETWDGDGHSHSWLSVAELSGFDYEAITEDRRHTVQTGPNSWNGAATAAAGQGEKMTYREFLGEGFFADLAKLLDIGAERIVFWFDN